MQADEPAWNRALRSWFFRPDLAGRPAYLAVDQETLTAIARKDGLATGDAAQALSDAVRNRVSPEAPLRPWVNEAIRWRSAGRASDPPFLTVLAITVLAATIVDRVNDRSYYGPLNRLLGLPGNVMPRDFDNDIQQLWTYLNEWLTDVCHGKLGTATASNIGGQANVGWAQSQTLLRPTDRAKLPLFFNALGAQPRQLVDGNLLVRRLRSWSASHALSRRMSVVLQDPRLSDLLGAALHSELAHWDGTLRDESGRLALKLLLAFHARSGELQAAIQVSGQLAGTTWQLNSLDSPLKLGRDGELELLPLPITSELLDGLSLHAEPDRLAVPDSGSGAIAAAPTLTLVMPRRDVHLLCPDDRLARWVEVPAALLCRPHLVLVRSELADTAIDAIERLGGDAQFVRRIRCPAGWVSYRFIPTRFHAIEGPMAVLSPRGNSLSALEGGLPISKRRRVYLTPGAPDVVLDLREPTTLITIDNTEASRDSAGFLHLSSLGLSSGGHVISVGGVQYRLTLVDEFADEPRDCTLSFAFDISRKDERADGTVPIGVTATAHQRPSDVMVSGAAIRTSLPAETYVPVPRPPRSRTGGRHFALGHPGQAAEIRADPPRWLRSLQVQLAPHLVDAASALAELPFPPKWLLRISQAGTTVSAVETDTETHSEQAASEVTPDPWAEVLPYIEGAVPDTDDAVAWSAWKQAAITDGTSPGLDP